MIRTDLPPRAGAVLAAAVVLLAGCAAAPPLSGGCAALAGAAIAGGRVTRAEMVPAGTVRLAGRTSANTFAVPEHCNLEGRVSVRIGSDGKPYAIGFNLRLPVAWNGRFLFQGGGGTDGVIRPAVGTLPGGGQPAGALMRGFAVVSTDAGHQDEPGPTGPFLFGLEPRARIDLGYAHLPAVNSAALALIERAYGSAPHHRYFAGCSNGGRQGMMASQRYPDMFDGILAGAPAYRVPFAAAEAMRQTQLLASVAPRAADGRPLLGSALSRAELATLAAGIVAACDAADGVRDGMVHNIEACRFRPRALLCLPGNAQDCIAPGKTLMLEKLFDGARLASGQRVYSDWPYDPGVADPGWIAWRIGLDARAMPPAAVNTGLVAGALAYVFTTPPDRPDDLYDYALDYNPETGLPKLSSRAPPFDQSAEEFNNPISTDLGLFKAHGGKLIFYHGMADPIFSALDTLRYYQLLSLREGAAGAAGFSRLYLVPGMTHCSGGPATDQFELLEPLVNWVENEVAPTVPIARAGTATPWPGRTRPLCAWPQQTYYKGQGDPEKAASFACR